MASPIKKNEGQYQQEPYDAESKTPSGSVNPVLQMMEVQGSPLTVMTYLSMAYWDEAPDPDNLPADVEEEIPWDKLEDDRPSSLASSEGSNKPSKNSETPQQKNDKLISKNLALEKKQPGSSGSITASLMAQHNLTYDEAYELMEQYGL